MRSPGKRQRVQWRQIISALVMIPMISACSTTRQLAFDDPSGENLEAYDIFEVRTVDGDSHLVRHVALEGDTLVIAVPTDRGLVHKYPERIPIANIEKVNAVDINGTAVGVGVTVGVVVIALLAAWGQALGAGMAAAGH